MDCTFFVKNSDNLSADIPQPVSPKTKKHRTRRCFQKR